MNSKITFPELIELVAEATNTSKRMSELFLKELFATVSQALINGESVRIKNLGQFKIEEVKSRKSVSVNTGQEVEIPSHNRLVFTPAKSLADAVNEPFAHFETVVLDDDVTDEQLAAVTGDVVPAEAPVVPLAEEPDEEVVPSLDEEVETSGDENNVESGENLEDEVVTPDSPALTPPPFMPLVQVPEIPVEEPAEEPDLEPLSEPVASTPEPENEPVAEPQYDDEDDDDHPSIVEFEKTKRDIARKSTIRGAIYGALGMLVLILAGWGVYSLGVNSHNHNAVQADTITVDDKDEMSTGEQVMRQDIADADTTAPAPAEEPAKPQVVTDTCTKTMFLTRMAKKHYGSRDFWVYIYEENKDKLDNPNNITPGTIVVIPPVEKYGIDPNDPESVKQARIKSAQVFAQFPSGNTGKAVKKNKYRKR